MNKLYEIYSHKYTALIGRLVIGSLFIMASLGKLSDPVSFAQTFINYNLLPQEFAPLAAVFLPWFEFIGGVMIIVGFRRRLMGFSFTLLLIVFTIGISINIARGADMGCGCFDIFGTEENMTIFTVIRDIFFIALAIPPMICEEKFLELDSLIEKD